MIRLLTMGFVTAILVTGVAASSWPGGTPANVTPSGFGNNVSGAVWNPVTQTLWTTENSPGIVRKSVYDAQSSIWTVVQSWQPGGDLESITFRDFDDASVFVGVERDAINHRVIREYSTPSFTLLREWDLMAMLFGPANDGLEALTFVPDAALAAMHFVDATGQSYEASQFGTGGLFLAGHQDTGQIFFFDLDRAGSGTNRPHVHVATLATGQSEIAGLEFDRSNGLLYAWHDEGIDKLQVFGADGTGHFGSKAIFDNPFCCDWNTEGLAIVDNTACEAGGRSLLLTRDQPLSSDPSLYEDRAFPCDCNGNVVGDLQDIASHSSADTNTNGVPDECEDLPPTSVGDDVARLGHLGSAFPNPFGTSTRIQFEMPGPGTVELVVLDVAGRHVRTLVSGLVPAGSGQARWDGKDASGRPVASGVYLCRMQSGGRVEMQRLVRAR